MGYAGLGGSGYDYEVCPVCGNGLWNGCCENPDCEYHWYPKEEEEDMEDENSCSIGY